MICKKCGKKYALQPTTNVDGEDNQRSKNIEALEALAITAFKKDKKAWLDFLGSEYGCNLVEELTIDQFQNCIKKLNERIKDAKK